MDSIKFKVICQAMGLTPDILADELGIGKDLVNLWSYATYPPDEAVEFVERRWKYFIARLEEHIDVLTNKPIGKKAMLPIIASATAAKAAEIDGPIWLHNALMSMLAVFLELTNRDYEVKMIR